MHPYRLTATGFTTLFALAVFVYFFHGLGWNQNSHFALLRSLVEYHTAGGVVDWRPVWLVPAAGTLAAALVFALCFRERAAPPVSRRFAEA